MKTILLLTIVLFVVLLFELHQVNAGRPPPTPVSINKCCRIGEQMIVLNDTNALTRNEKCMAGGTEKWVPHVYLLNLGRYFVPRGEAPRFLNFREATLPDNCPHPQLFQGATNLAIFSNGSLFMSEKSTSVPAEYYCVDKDLALVCLPLIDATTVNQSMTNGTIIDNVSMDSLTAPIKLSKIRKCCGQRSVYGTKDANCISVTNNSHPVFAKSIQNSTMIDYIFGFPICHTSHNQYTIAGKFKQDMLNESTGSITLSDIDRQFSWDEYCLEHTLDDVDTVGSYVNIFTCTEQIDMSAEYVPVEKSQDIRYVLFSIGLIISVIFLSATLATGFLLPSNHHMLHWRCQTYYVACLLVGEPLLAIAQIFITILSNPTACFAIAIIMHFSFLAAFFWLNTMCFNIWWTFRDFRPTSLEKGQEVVRLRIYKAYAWGFPLLITCIGAILDSMPEHTDNNFIRPGFCIDRIWFSGDKQILWYFYGPVGFLLFINLLLFASTARQLTCGLWKRDDVKSTTERAALGRVCLKLVVVMGVIWVADVISWAVGGPHYLWYLTDVLNTLHGVFIFIVVGCQPQVWTAIKRIWSSKTGRGTHNQVNGPQHSSSSHGLPSIGESVTNNTFTNTTTNSKIPMETIC